MKIAIFVALACFLSFLMGWLVSSFRTNKKWYEVLCDDMDKIDTITPSPTWEGEMLVHERLMDATKGFNILGTYMEG